jgi:hypothetical protein
MSELPLRTGYRRSVTSASSNEPDLLPRQRYTFRSSQASHAAAVLGITLKEAGALDCSDEEIDAAVDICRALADLAPRGEGVPTRKLYERLGGRYPRQMLENRLRALMRAGSVEKDRDVINEQDVRLTLSGSLSLILVPWLSSMSGQRALLEMLSRAQERAASPGATVEDVRADLAELRRVLSTFASQLRRIVDDRKTGEMIEYAQESDDRELRIRIARLREIVVKSFTTELIDDLERLGGACEWYLSQQLRLLKLLSSTRGTRGHWIRADEVHEVMRTADPARLAALWDGITFDEAPVWVNPDTVLKAVTELVSFSAEAPVPEPAERGAELAGDTGPREILRALAEQLLDGADQRDLTEVFLTLPWPAPAVILARLTLLTGLDIGYALSYPGHLALRSGEATVRVATGVTLRRTPTNPQDGMDSVRGSA